MAQHKPDDDDKYTDDQDVVTLSPILEDSSGPQFHYGSFSGEVPSDPMGFISNGIPKGKRNGKE